jgi:hypothetical protein
MGASRWLAAAAAVFLLSEPCAARPLDFDRVSDPAVLCRALASYGLDGGNIWQESTTRRGGWSCERNGAIRGCGKAGTSEPAGDIAYYVFGSGPGKIDRVVLHLTMEGGDSESCRAQLRELADALSIVIGITLPAKIADLIATVSLAGEPASGAATGRNASRRILHEERKGWVRVRLTAEDSRLRVLLVTFANPNASRVWD